MDSYVKKALHYIGKRAIILGVIVVLCVLVFSVAFNTTKVRTFTGDAMEDRAAVLLQHEGTEDLQKYFDASYIEKDQELIKNEYSYYHVAGYDYQLEIKRVSVFWIAPSRATVTAEERVEDIRGMYEGSEEDKVGRSDHPPAWQNAQYKIKMSKHEGRWYITEIEKIKDLVD